METIQKSLEHAPALGAMIVIVFAFLKFLKAMLDSHAKRTEEFIATVKDLNRENMEARNQSRHVIEENTRAAAQNTVAMNEMTTVMREFNRKAT